MSTIYSGPGKVYINSVALQAEGVNGEVNIALNEETAPIAVAMFGRISEQTADETVEITTRPFDNWGSLATLYPALIGVTVGAGTGALNLGVRPHGSSNLPAVVWTPDGRLYTAVRSAVVGHPTLHLGIGKALFDSCRIACLPDLTKAMGASGYLVSGNAITESGGADPGGAFVTSDLIRGAWTGVWGTVAGFGGAAGSAGTTDAIQAEDEWTVSFNVQYSPLKVQMRTIAMKLDSVEIMAKVKPFGPSHTDIVARVGAHTHGQRLGSADLVLTGPSSKTVTLKNAEVRGAGFRFGGTTLGTDEVAFVNTMLFTAGAPQPLLIFSA